MFRRNRVPLVIQENNEQAEAIKSEIIESAKNVELETEKLNRLMAANGYTLLIAIATGLDRRKTHGHKPVH